MPKKTWNFLLFSPRKKLTELNMNDKPGRGGCRNVDPEWEGVECWGVVVGVRHCDSDPRRGGQRLLPPRVGGAHLELEPVHGFPVTSNTKKPA